MRSIYTQRRNAIDTCIEIGFRVKAGILCYDKKILTGYIEFHVFQNISHIAYSIIESKACHL